MIGLGKKTLESGEKEKEKGNKKKNQGEGVWRRKKKGWLFYQLEEGMHLT